MVNPAQRVIADAEPAAIVGQDDGPAQEVMVTDRAPQPSLGVYCDLRAVEQVIERGIVEQHEPDTRRAVAAGNSGPTSISWSERQ